MCKGVIAFVGIFLVSITFHNHFQDSTLQNPININPKFTHKLTTQTNISPQSLTHLSSDTTNQPINITYLSSNITNQTTIHLNSTILIQNGSKNLLKNEPKSPTPFHPNDWFTEEPSKSYIKNYFQDINSVNECHYEPCHTKSNMRSSLRLILIKKF